MAEKRSGARRQTTRAAEKRAGSRTTSRTEKQAAEKRGGSRTTSRTEKQAAEKRAGNRKEAATRNAKRAADDGRGSRKEATSRTDHRAAEKRGADGRQTTAGKPHRSETSRNGITAPDAVSRARRALAGLLGLPVEGVLGIDRDGDHWVATVQVLELARIPNATDVLGEYEIALDGHGEVVRYHRTRRYRRGQVEGSQQ